MFQARAIKETPVLNSLKCHKPKNIIFGINIQLLFYMGMVAKFIVTSFKKWWYTKSWDILPDMCTAKEGFYCCVLLALLKLEPVMLG